MKNHKTILCKHETPAYDYQGQCGTFNGRVGNSSAQTRKARVQFPARAISPFLLLIYCLTARTNHITVDTQINVIQYHNGKMAYPLRYFLLRTLEHLARSKCTVLDANMANAI